MIRIRSLDSPPMETRNSRLGRKDHPRGIVSIFRRALVVETTEVERFSDELDRLIEQLDETGERLEKEPTMDAFRTYRDLLGTITRRVIDMAYRLDKVGGTPFDPRYHERVTVIDREADSLLRIILSRQKDRMEITRKVMEIKGLVIDLVS